MLLGRHSPKPGQVSRVAGSGQGVPSGVNCLRVFIALTVLVALAACSNTRPPRNQRGAVPTREDSFRGGPNAMILKYDADHDGRVTKAELDAGLHADFDRFDTAHAGCLSPDQVAAINAERIRVDQASATPLQDFQQNGCVDFAEFAAAPASVFAELDRDGDGVVTAQEINPRQGPGNRGGPPSQGTRPDGSQPGGGGGPPGGSGGPRS